MFKNIRERIEVLYRCEKCGGEDWYIIELPEDMREHMVTYNTPTDCLGRLVEVRRRPRGDTTGQAGGGG
jgi:hypothetical protein